MSKNKTLLIGWDAADWALLNPLIEKGAMPTLKKLVEKGVKGKLASLEPMISPVLWTSIATGRRGYSHGIHGFVEAKPLGDGIRPIRASKRQVPALWNVLNRFGFKTHIINWWPSHPAENVDGVMVSNFYGIPEQKNEGRWPLMKGAVSPEKLTDVFSALQLHPSELTSSILRPFFPDYGPLDENDAVVQSVAKILAHTCSTHNAITHVIEEEDWDFAAVYYNGLDHFLHVANRFAPPKMDIVSELDFQKYHFIVEAACRFHDMMLARLIDLSGETCNIVLISDHGFDTGKQRKAELPTIMGAPSLEHQPYGVFLGYGPDFKEGEALRGASLLDICPTILQLFNCPIATDLEGDVLHGAFKTKQLKKVVPSYSSIPSYTTTGREDKAISDDEMLQQLQALGYVSGASLNADQQIAAVLRENRYYLARSFVDGQRYSDALRVLAELTKEDPSALRFSYLFLHAAFQAGEMGLAKKQLTALEAIGHGEDIRSLFYNGLLAINQEKPMEAARYFDRVLEDSAHRSGIAMQIANAYVQANAWERAKSALLKVQVSNISNPDQWHALLARCCYENKEFEGALEAVLEAIDLVFAEPERHALLSQIFWALDQKSEALQALQVAVEMAPRNSKYVEQLLQWSHEIGDSAIGIWAKEKRQKTSKTITVVSGLPRSGTSLLMQILQAHNLELFTDNKRGMDIHNPKGYFESEAVKKIATDSAFLNQAVGKVIKIVAPLVQFVPDNYTYKVIFLHRSITEVVVSQEKMKGTSREQLFAFFPFERALKLEHLAATTLEFLKKAPHISLLEIAYKDIVNNPDEVAAALSTFLEKDIDKKEIESVLDESLYRSKV